MTDTLITVMNWSSYSRHDRRMIVTLIVAIAVGVAMPFPINIIQPVLCALSLFARL